MRKMIRLVAVTVVVGVVIGGALGWAVALGAEQVVRVVRGFL